MIYKNKLVLWSSFRSTKIWRNKSSVCSPGWVLDSNNKRQFSETALVTLSPQVLDFRFCSPPSHWTPVFSALTCQNSPELCHLYFHSLKALDSRQLTQLHQDAAWGRGRLEDTKAVTPGANWSRAVTQLWAELNSLETAGSRGEATKRYHVNPEGQEETQAYQVASLPD